MRAILLILFLFLAPLGGTVLALQQGNSETPPDLFKTGLTLPLDGLQHQAEQVSAQARAANQIVNQLQLSAEERERQFREQELFLEELLQQSLAQTKLSREIYEKQLLEKLGEPSDTFYSGRVAALIFPFNGEGYRGHLVKIRLLDPAALRVGLARNTYGKLETTSAAARRTGAVFAVNGGSFSYTGQSGQAFYRPYGNTVIDGQLLGNFVPAQGCVFFCGLSRSGTLLGGQFRAEGELMALQPAGGVSWTPILIQDHQPLPIPSEWRATRHPRTIAGSFANDEIFFIVVDGRQPGWSNGVTLEEIQLRLAHLGVINAYNLDGGGSSTLYFQGRVMNRPSDGRERAVATHFLLYP